MRRSLKLVILDFNRTIWDPEGRAMVPGALKLLGLLRELGLRTVLVSAGEGARQDLVKSLALSEFFDGTIFCLEKSARLFRDICSEQGVEPCDCCVIGDHIHHEIRAGNQIGALTIHVRAGLFADLQAAQPSDVAALVAPSLSHVTEWFQAAGSRVGRLRDVPPHDSIGRVHLSLDGRNPEIYSSGS